jgi:hypothetical protein
MLSFLQNKLKYFIWAPKVQGHLSSPPKQTSSSSKTIRSLFPHPPVWVHFDFMDPDPDYLYELNLDPNQQHCQKLVSKGKDRNIQERTHRMTDDTCTISVSVIYIFFFLVLILTVTKYCILYSRKP